MSISAVQCCRLLVALVGFATIGASAQEKGTVHIDDETPPPLDFGCHPPSTCVVPRPILSFTASSTAVQTGTPVVLSWDVDPKSNHAYIHDSSTNTYFVVKWNDLGPSSGQRTFKPTQSTVYTLLAGFGPQSCYGRQIIYIKTTGKWKPKIVRPR